MQAKISLCTYYSEDDARENIGFKMTLNKRT
jgi:hypothetical protein